MLATGEWRADHPERGERVAGFHLSSLYAPLGWVSWPDLVREHLAAEAAAKRGDVSLRRVFVNTRLAETYDDGVQPSTAHALAERAEDYPLGSVPAGVVVLTAGIDVQANRLECFGWGWGREDRSWLVDFRRFDGAPAERAVWQELAAYLREPIGQHRIRAAGVDSGYQSSIVYDFTRTQRHCFALKGSSRPAQPIVSRPNAVEIAGKRTTAQVYSVGTDTAKTLLYGRLAIASPGPGYVHLTSTIADEIPGFFEQLTAERLVTRYRGGHPVRRWHKPQGARNEALDCYVYALAAYRIRRFHRVTSAQWDQVEGRKVKTAETAEAASVPPPTNDDVRSKVLHPGFGRSPFGGAGPRRNWTMDWRR